jgi:hypothetical protein
LIFIPTKKSSGCIIRKQREVAEVDDGGMWTGGNLPKDDDSLVALIWKLYKRARDSRSEWEERAKECFRFFNGEHYTEDEKLVLNRKQTPALTINRIFARIRDKKALSLRGIPEIKIYPRGKEDVGVADAFNELVKFVQDQNNMQLVQDQVNQDALVGGIGWGECIFDPDAEDGSPDIQINEADPFTVFPDPDSQRPDLEDAEYIIKAQKLSVQKILRMFPGKKDEIPMGGESVAPFSPPLQLDLAEDDYGSHGLGKERKEEDEDTLLLLECWIKEHSPGAIFYDPVNQDYVTVDVDKKGRPKGVEPEQLAGLEHIKNRRYKIRLVHIVGNVVLQNVLSPYIHNRFPLVPLYCYVSRDSGRLRWFGEIENAKEPQRVQNKIYSLMLHNIATMTNSIWVVRTGTKDISKIENAGATPGTVIEVGGAGPISEQIQRLPGVAAVTEATRAQEMLKYEVDHMTGVYQVQRGETGGAKSGKHMESLVEQGQISTEGIALYASIFRKQLGRIIASNIQQFYKDRDIGEIIGFRKDGSSVNMEESLKDMATLKFDVIVSQAESKPTTLLEKYMVARDLYETTGGRVINDEELLDFVPIDVDKEKIKQRMQQEKQMMLMMGATGGESVPEGGTEK